MYAVPGELDFFLFLFGPFHVIGASQILINYSLSQTDAIFPSLSRQAHSGSDYNIYNKHYYVMGTLFKWPLANSER